MRSLLRILVIGLTTILMGVGCPWSRAQAVSQAASIGQYPAGPTVSQIIVGQPFNVYAQICQPPLTSTLGRTPGITCQLTWSPVDYFEGPWQDPMETPMTFTGDIGESDEYRAILSPELGLYEYRTVCTDAVEHRILQPVQNGRLIVTLSPKDQYALWFGENLIAWNIPESETVFFELHYERDGQFSIPTRKGTGIPLQLVGKVTGTKYPYWFELLGYRVWRVPNQFLMTLPDRLDTKMAVAAYTKAGDLVSTTRIQLLQSKLSPAAAQYSFWEN